MTVTKRSPAFIHLRTHTEYSIVDGLLRINSLVGRCVEQKMPAIAVTDQSNMCGLVRFYKAANTAGVKPIVGLDAWVHDKAVGDAPFRIVFLCMNRKGYVNLTELISESYLKGQSRGYPVIETDWMHSRHEGLIVLSGGREGDVGKSILSGNHQLAAERLAWWNQLFSDRYYLELQRTCRENEESYIHAIVGMAQGSSTPVVATNDVMFDSAEDFEAHEARVCINQGRVLDDPGRPHHYSEQQYLKTAEEMCELFADIPSALENSVEISRRCNLEISLGEAFLPDFPVPEGMTIDEFFTVESKNGLEQRLNELFDVNSADFRDKRKIYDERLDLELKVILQMGFPGYFLVVADFIKWSKANDIPVGPGRGSGAGSLVAYVLKITDLDPLAYDLLFERFLNPERVSMPDFDVDFCMDGRDRVIEYVADKYGKDAVSQIITFGTMAAKAVIRDVGRVLGKPYGFCDQLSKMIPFDLGITLDKAFEQEEAIREAYENDDDVKELWDLAKKLEGVVRNAGKHAGGVVIAPTKLTDFTPLYCDDTGANIVAQFDKDDVEAVGLVKFDFLGLKTLTIIDWAIKTLNRTHPDFIDNPLSIDEISLQDEATFMLLQRGDTTAVFQLESAGMKKLIKQLKPNTFEDIVALVALYRPGPLGSGMDQDFVNRKHGREAVKYPHPLLESILKPTYGTILYQEQVMQIAQVLAGYSLGEADLLRRAMGKKKMEVMQEQRLIFVKGASKKGIDEKVSSLIFDIMEEFAKYGFNKSHSAAYALVSFQTAWLKAHYPAAFLAAAMSADMDNTDKVVILVDDVHSLGLKLLPPDVNRGDYHFTVHGSDTIIYGIGAIKGVGQAAIESIVNERNENGHFTDLFDFCMRVDLKKSNRRVLEALIKAGALDSFGRHRAELIANLDEAIQAAEQAGRDKLAGQNDMFGGPAIDSQIQSHHYQHIRPWPENHKLQCEKDTLGLYLTGHPINRYRKELSLLVSKKIKQAQPTGRGKSMSLAGLVVGVRIIKTKAGTRIAIATIDDQTARIDIAIYNDLYEQSASMIAKDKILIAEGEVSFDDFNQGLKMRAKNVWDITAIREQRAKNLSMDVVEGKVPEDFAVRLKHQLAPFVGGTCPISLQFKASQAKAVIDLGGDWRVTPSDELIYRLEDLVGDGMVRCVYP
ncbi:MAG TPA: DNA polymerase III subunit alpha [Aeromonadales bacterium]|nr:DNA polymerase III subunit alpha [Aeromonadales bacterium]